MLVRKTENKEIPIYIYIWFWSWRPNT